MERNGPRRSPPRVHVDFLSSRVITVSTQDEHDLPTRFNQGPSRPHCLDPFSFPFLSTSRSRTIDNVTKAAATRQPCALLHPPLVLNLRTHLQTALLLAKEGTIASIVLESRSLGKSFPLLSACSFLLSAIIQWNLCPHDLGRSLALALLSRPLFSFPSYFLLPSYPISYLGRHPALAATLSATVYM